MTRKELAMHLNEEIGALRRFALHLTRDFDEADDLTQDTIERALRKAHLFDGKNLRSWLFTVCRRVFLNQLRKRKTRGPWVAIEDAPPSALSVYANPDSAIELSRLQAGYRRLSSRDRAVLDLVALEGRRYEDAARALKVPVGTVRSRLSRARGRLHDMMERGAAASA